jgi:hypothetical protein
MAILDLRPQVVDVNGYAGDTLEIAVVVPTTYINGRTFSAQVRPVVGSDVLSATFEITEPVEPNGPAFLRLPSAVTRALVETGGARVRTRELGITTNIMRFSGVWDCQLSLNGGDPVRTVAKGALYIDMDVTEETPGQ